MKLNRLLACMLFGGLLSAGLKVAPPVLAMPLSQVISTLRDANGYYSWASATLKGADCSGLVSVAQSLATGQVPHRLGDTHTLLAGAWPDVIPGASQDDSFIIAANSGHMVAQIDGVGIEAKTRGTPWAIGPDATSVWAPQFRRWHVNPAVLAA